MSINSIKNAIELEKKLCKLLDNCKSIITGICDAGFSKRSWSDYSANSCTGVIFGANTKKVLFL